MMAKKDLKLVEPPPPGAEKKTVSFSLELPRKSPKARTFVMVPKNVMRSVVSNFQGVQQSLIFAVLELTIGDGHRFDAEISQRKFSKMTNSDQGGISRQLKILQDRNVLIKTEQLGNRDDRGKLPDRWRVNLNPGTWILETGGDDSSHRLGDNSSQQGVMTPVSTLKKKEIKTKKDSEDKRGREGGDDWSHHPQESPPSPDDLPFRVQESESVQESDLERIKRRVDHLINEWSVTPELPRITFAQVKAIRESDDVQLCCHDLTVKELTLIVERFAEVVADDGYYFWEQAKSWNLFQLFKNWSWVERLLQDDWREQFKDQNRPDY